MDGAGNVTVWTCSVASGTSAEQSYGETRFPFQPPNVRFAYKRNPDSPLPFGWMRGVGFTQHLWMNFGFLDGHAESLQFQKVYKDMNHNRFDPWIVRHQYR